MSRFLAFLSHFSLARLFSLTRYLEEQLARPCEICLERADRIAEMRATITRQENYILSMLGKPPINPPQSQSSATIHSGSQNLRQIRRTKVAEAVRQALDAVNDNGMVNRADEFADKVNGAGSN